MGRSSRSLRIVVLGGVATLVAWKSNQAFTKKEVQDEVSKVVKPWNQPHNLRVSNAGYEVSSISQGGDQWQVALAEAGGDDKPGAFLRNLDGDLVYGFEYDSDKSRFGIPKSKVKRVAFSTASKGDNLDWTLHLDGDGPNHFSATGDSGSVLYDASVGVEVPVPGTKGVSARYALDAKRRAGAENVLPNWLRHSAGLRYASPLGNLKVNLQQADPAAADGKLGYEAVLEGDISGPQVRGSPHYTLRASQEAGVAAYGGNLKLTGPTGFTGSLDVQQSGGQTSLSGQGQYAGKRTVAKGIEVGLDAKVSATPEDLLQLQPVGVTASADLAQLVPSVADKGSSLDLRARYKLGAERPAISAVAKLKNQRLAAMELEAQADVDEEGTVSTSGKVSVSGRSQNVLASYKASTAGGNSHHAAEVLYPAELKSGGARAYGRLYQHSDQFDGKPRLQLGLQYDTGLTVAGRQLRVQGESAGYDSGSQLLEGGQAWDSARLKRARNSASTLQARIKSADGQGNQWLRK